MTKFLVILVSALVLLPRLGAAAAVSNQQSGTAGGAIDLTEGWAYHVGDIQTNGAGNLSKDWKRTVSPGDPSDRGTNRIVWYRVQLPAVNAWGPGWDMPALCVKEILGEFRIYAPDRLVYSQKPGVYTLHELEKWLIVPLEKKDAGGFLYFRVESKEGQKIGIPEKVSLSSYGHFISGVIQGDFVNLVLGAFFVLIGVVLLSIFYLLGTNEKLTILALGFFALCGGVFCISVTQVKAYILDVPLLWSFLRLSSLVLFPVGITLFMERLFGGNFRYLLRFLCAVNLILALYIMVMSFLDPAFTGGDIMFVAFYVLVAVEMVLGTILAVREALKGSLEAILFSVGLGLFFLCGLVDIVVQVLGIFFRAGKELGPSILFYQYGLFLFLVFQAVLLTLRFSSHARELENKVAERTRELSEERNKLKVRNEVMENELVLAREIQLQLVPSKSPAPNISFYYKSMDQVGGDFYDFIDFGDKKRVGIFLSDVSGHGVPAAFITSMIKSFILQSGQMREDPSRLMSFLNQSLFNQTNGNFITAFYGVFDMKTGEFAYANAGHNSPYVIHNANGKNARLEFLDNEKKNIPLAVLSNGELETIRKSYATRSVTLDQGSKLFLYTDGLVEAVNIQEKMVNDQTQDFESAYLKDAVADLAGLPSADFISRIVDKLIQFRGSDSFEDDVCMICVDV